MYITHICWPASLQHLAWLSNDEIYARYGITIQITTKNGPDRYNDQKTQPFYHNERYGVSNHQRLDCLLKRLFRRRSKKKSKLRVTGLCEGNSPVTGEFLARTASNVENVSIWWCRHVKSEAVNDIAKINSQRMHPFLCKVVSKDLFLPHLS